MCNLRGLPGVRGAAMWPASPGRRNPIYGCASAGRSSRASGLSMAQNIVHEPALGQSAIASTEHATAGKKSGLAALAVGSMGVVYGDIGTSPLYALRESLVHVQST